MLRLQVLTSAAVLSLALAAPSTAGQTSGPKKGDANEKIQCKTEQVVGSRTRERVCKTRAEWERLRAMTLEVLDHRGGGSMSSPPPTVGGSGG